MQWGQFEHDRGFSREDLKIDDTLSKAEQAKALKEKLEEKWESWSLTIANVGRARKRVTKNDVFPLYYYGKTKLEKIRNAPHHRINIKERSAHFPWFIDLKRCSIGRPLTKKQKDKRRKFIKNEEDKRIGRQGPRHASTFKKFRAQAGQVVSTVYRKFESDYSLISLKLGETYKFNSGFRVYASHSATKANAKGHNPIPIEIKLFEAQEIKIALGSAKILAWSIMTALALFI